MSDELEDMLFDMKLAEAKQILPPKLFNRYAQYMFHERVDNYLINVDNATFFQLVQSHKQEMEALQDERTNK